VKYADKLLLLAKAEAVLQGVIERLVDIGRCYGMEMNAGKNKVMRISSQLSPLQIMTDQKQPEDVDCFSYLGSVITSDARCTHEINPGLPWHKQHSTRITLNKVIII
jgi:hypothetical protein